MIQIIIQFKRKTRLFSNETFFFTSLLYGPLFTERNKHGRFWHWLLLHSLIVVVGVLVVHRALEVNFVKTVFIMRHVSTNRKWHLVLKEGKLDSKGLSHVWISIGCVRDCVPKVKAVI